MEEKHSEEKVIRQLEERLLQSDVRKSAKEIANLLANDFVEFGSSGRVFNKQQIIEALQQESPIQRSLLEFKALTLAPNIVLATYRIVQHNASDQQPTHSLRSSLWKLIDGNWKMVFHQGTPVEES